MSSSEPQTKANNATIGAGCCCKACGWPVVVARCDDEMSTQGRYAEHDGWAYCANKTCINHDGAGLLQGRVDFASYAASPGEDRLERPKLIDTGVGETVSRLRLPGAAQIQPIEDWAERN